MTGATIYLVELIGHGVIVGRDRGQELGAGKRETLLKLLHVTENKYGQETY